MNMHVKTLKCLVVLLVLLRPVAPVNAQCSNHDFSISVNPVCGNEEVTFTINSPNPNLSYFWNFGQGAGVDATGESVTHVYPARDFDRDYNVTVFNGQGSCVQVVTVPSTPDAALEAVTGVMVDDYTISYCESTTDFPEFDLTVQNTSTTTGANTNYTIDWGDGTSAWSGSNFTTVSHTYASQGQFFLTLTVTGSTNCPSSSTVYEVYNSSDPGGSIVNTTNTVTTCYPNTIGYPILGTENNIAGTTYEISISGELTATYNHPPPDTFYHTFNETSCDQGYAPFDEDEFVIEMKVLSPCQDKLSFVTARLGTPPLAGFDMLPSVICPGETILLTNTSDGSESSQALCSEIEEANWMIEPRTYNIIQGDTINSQVLEIEPLEEVEYTITMWVENMCGVDTAVQVAEVGENPVADADALLSPATGCAPNTAVITNFSTDSAAVYDWNVTPSSGWTFVSGTGAADYEPEIRFDESGMYLVVLTVTNECGSATWDTSFSIISRPGIDLAPIDNQCVDTFYFDAPDVITGNANSVDWVFSGGTPATFSGEDPPPVIFAGTGSYSVQVTASNGCGDSTVIRNFDVSDPIAMDAGPDFTACHNGPPQTLTASPAGGVWSGEGIVGTDVFDPSATVSQFITLTYTYDNGICVANDTRQVEVIRTDSLTAGPDESVCVNDDPYDLSGGDPPGGWWFGPGITDAAQGTIDPGTAGLGAHAIGYVYSEPVMGCLDTVYKTVTVMDVPPIVLGTESNACLGALVTLSTDTVNGATAIWDFGDGNSEEGFEVGHVFTSEATFTVTVTVSAGQGCVNTDSTLLHVFDLPQVGFTADNPIGCNGLNVNFTNTTTGLSDGFLWDFGTGDTSTAADPSNIYFPPGDYNDTTYYVTLTADNFCGTESYTDSIVVTKPPEAVFGTDVNTLCPGQELYFNNISYNSPDGFFWDFGNGNTSTDQNPAPQTYPTPPSADTTYTITLVAWNQCGSDTLTRDIRVKTTDVVSFFNTDPIEGCEPLEVEFINYSTLHAFPVWDFGDGNTSTEDTVQHVFQHDGIYTISLAVDNGCSRDTSTTQVTVRPSPEIDFNYEAIACARKDVAFTNQSAGAFGFLWEFGDGNTSTIVHPVHNYLQPGAYDVTLTGENQYGCTSALSAGIDIRETPVADFDAVPNNVCSGEAVDFVNTGTGADNFHWEFGDGSSGYDPDPDHIYTTPGFYDVTLIVDNDNLCFDTISYAGVIQVFPTPVSAFDYKQSGEQATYGQVEFFNQSEDATSWEWDLGDGTLSAEFDLIHQYDQSGVIPVTLTSINDFGCRDSVTRDIEIEFFGKLFVPNALSPSLGTQTEAAIFLPKGVALADYEMEIYSSYGELLWRTTELIDGRPAEGWDGTFNGKPLPQDVYVWKIRALFDNGSAWPGVEINDGVYTTVGTLTLIR